MTWFLRKAFHLGPLRLNLSKRGLGASVGVKGARVGVDAQGKEYVAGGRGGIYSGNGCDGTTSRSEPGWRTR